MDRRWFASTLRAVAYSQTRAPSPRGTSSRPGRQEDVGDRFLGIARGSGPPGAVGNDVRAVGIEERVEPAAAFLPFFLHPLILLPRRRRTTSSHTCPGGERSFKPDFSRSSATVTVSRGTTPDGKGGSMYARVATFEGDPSRVDDAINMVRSQVQSDETPGGLEGAKMLMLVNRETGKGIGITLFDNEDAMQRGDEALNAMNPEGTERRTSVEYFEVPVETATSS